MSGKVLKKTFHAWNNVQPPNNDTLIVVGEVQFPTLGWHAELVEAEPQGINPTILILDLKSTAPTGIVGQIVTMVPVRYVKGGGHQYKQVSVRDGSSDFTIDVHVTE